ncbi:MAG: hypothetical protein ACRD3C_17940 [Vicinamibacterales bacterium]
MPIGSRAAIALTLVLTVACFAATGDAHAQQANQALTHFSHVATGFNGTPGGRGLAVTAAMEVNTAMMYANFAAGHPTDLAAMQTNVRYVLHALVPQPGTKGMGLGFGVKQAAELVVTHIEMAVNAPGASATMRKLGPDVAIAARAGAARAQAMADLGGRVLAAQTAAQAAPIVEQLRTLALQLDTGRDANGNGRIDLDRVEPGMNQLEAQVYSIFEGEQLPRALK